MHADEAIRAARARGNLGDRQGRGVGGEERVRRAHLVEPRQHLVLHAQILEHRLDDDVAARQVLDPRRARRGRQGCARARPPRAARASTDCCEKPLALAPRAGERVGAHVINDGAEAGARGDDGDARAHRAAAGDADGRDLRHRLSLA